MADSQDVRVSICSTRGVSIGSRHDVPSTSCVRRAALEQQPFIARVEDPVSARDLWFVTVTIGGDALARDEVQEALERLSVERAFLVGIRYDRTHAQVRYWDECADAAQATRQALSLWATRRSSRSCPAGGSAASRWSTWPPPSSSGTLTDTRGYTRWERSSLLRTDSTLRTRL